MSCSYKQSWPWFLGKYLGEVLEMEHYEQFSQEPNEWPMKTSNVKVNIHDKLVEFKSTAEQMQLPLKLH